MTTTVLRPNGGPTGWANLADDSDATSLTSATTRFTMTTKTLATGEIAKTATTRVRYGDGRAIHTTYFPFTNPAYSWGEFLPNHGTASPPITTESGTAQALPTTLTQSDIDGLEVLLTFSGGLEVFELYVDLVTVPRPVCAVDAITDPYTASTVIPVSWVNTLDSDGGAQTHYEVKVFTDAQYGAGGFDPGASTPTQTSGVVVSASTSTSVGPIETGDTYRVYVRSAQTVNGARHWSAWDFSEFALSVSTSDVTVVATPVDASGKIDVVVSRVALSEAWEFIEVERSTDGGTSWAAVRTASFVDATGDADSFAVTDHEAPNGRAVIYRARATYYSSGLPISGSWSVSSSTSWSSSEEWLKAPLSPSLNVTVEGVGYDPEARSTSAGVFKPVGRRVPVVVTDVLSAPAGSITVRTEGASEARGLDDLLEAGGVFLLNLRPASLIGPNRDGFAYVSVLSTSEEWATPYYLADWGHEDMRLTTISFVVVDAPPDATAGSI